MTTKRIIGLAAIALIVPAASHASWFEYCDLRGAIRNVEKTDDGYVVVVSVTDATRSKENGELGYTDCSEHRGKDTTLTLTGDAVPVVGDHIAFSRSAVDGFTADGKFAGTTVTTHLIKLNKKKP